MWLEGSLNENCFPNVLFNIISRVSTNSGDRFSKYCWGGEMSWILTNSCIKIAAIRGSVKRTRLPWATRACSWVGAKFRFYQLQTCKKFGFTQRHKLVGKWYQKIIYYYHLRKNMLLRMTYITWSAACILNLVLLKRNKKKDFVIFFLSLFVHCVVDKV